MNHPPAQPRHTLPAIVLAMLLLALLSATALAKDVIPPKPARYFNDYANVVSPADAQAMNQRLEDLEKQSSNQIVVAVFPRMQSDAPIEQYTLRIAEAWGVGQKKRDNGAILFVFIADRKMFIQVGYGLEGALTDYLSKQIIQQELAPRFRAGDYAGGLSNAVDAMIAATRGEYKGTGRTLAQGKGSNSPLGLLCPLMPLLLIVIVFSILRKATVYGPSGRRGHWHVTPALRRPGWGGGFGGGGFRGGGGFSGGGGRFGGGGAGGSW